MADIPDMPVSGADAAGPLKPVEPVPPPTGPDELPTFTTGPEGQPPKGPEEAQTKPSPMEAATDASRQQQQISPEELQGKTTELIGHLDKAQEQLKDPAVVKNLSPEHEEALSTLTDKITPDMQTIAKGSGTTFTPPEKGTGQSVLERVSTWITGSQNTLRSALNHMQTVKNPSPVDFLQMQYSVQRATQRAELFSSVIGSSVSGIKTIMSTQLG